MKDPICGMTGTIERHGHWFCSERCVKEFEQGKGRRRMLDPWTWVPVTALFLGTLGWWWPRAAEVSALYRMYLHKMGLPVLAGLVLGGVIDHFVPKSYIISLLSGPRKRVVVRSALLGFLASSCSHGCLALSVELYRKGASTPAVVSFLLASPWASMAFTFLLISLFGLSGVTIVVAALLIAIITGLIFQRLAARGLIEANPHSMMPEGRFSMRQDITERVQAYQWTPQQIAADIRGIIAGMVPLGRMVLGWVQFGLILSVLIGGLVPHSVFAHYLGRSVGGLLLTLLAATLVEVCSEGTAPVAFELYRHTGALGNAFTFLMAGVVTDYTELGVLWTVIGRRTVLWLLAVTLPLVLATGIVLNGFSP